MIAKVLAALRRHGLSPDDEPGALFDLAERSPALAGVQADSIAGRRVVRVGRLPGLGFVQPVGPDCVAQDGFSLHGEARGAGAAAARAPRDLARRAGAGGVDARGARVGGAEAAQGV